MKLLAVFLLVGLAFASAVPLFEDDLVKELDELEDELGDEFIAYSEGGLFDRLRERFEELVEKIKKRFDEGEGVDGDLFKKAQDLHDKLKKLGVEVSEKVKKIFEDLRSKLKGENAETGDEIIAYAEGVPGYQVRERFEQLLEKIKRLVDEGRQMPKDLFNRVQDIYHKLKNLGIHVRERYERIFEDLRSKFGENSPQNADFKDWKERLRQLRDRIQNHEFDVEKIRAFIEKLFGKSEMANQFIEMVQTRGEKGKQRLIDFINRLLGEKQEAFPLLDRLREDFEKMLEKMQKSLEDGKTVSKNMWKKAQDTWEKLTNMGVEFSDKMKQMYENIKSKMGKNSPEHADWKDWKDRLRQLRDKIQNHEFDEEKIRTFIENLFGKSEMTNQFLEMLKTKGEKGKQRLIDFINRLLGDKQDNSSVQHVEYSILSRLRERFENLISRMHKDMEDGKGVRGDLMKKLTDMYNKFRGLGGEMNGKVKEMFDRLQSRFDKSSPAEHSMKEIYEKVKKFFRDLNIELKEKYAKFGEYVKEQYHKGLDKTKSNIDNVKNIAHKFVEDSRKISKDLAEEALEFFRQYKDDLGHIYGDVVDKVRDILKKED